MAIAARHPWPQILVSGHGKDDYLGLIKDLVSAAHAGAPLDLPPHFEERSCIRTVSSCSPRPRDPRRPRGRDRTRPPGSRHTFVHRTSRDTLVAHARPPAGETPAAAASITVAITNQQARDPCAPSAAPPAHRVADDSELALARVAVRGDSRRNTAAQPALRKRRSQCRSRRIRKPGSRRSRRLVLSLGTTSTAGRLLSRSIVCVGTATAAQPAHARVADLRNRVEACVRPHPAGPWRSPPRPHYPSRASASPKSGRPDLGRAEQLVARAFAQTRACGQGRADDRFHVLGAATARYRVATAAVVRARYSFQRGAVVGKVPTTASEGAVARRRCCSRGIAQAGSATPPKGCRRECNRAASAGSDDRRDSDVPKGVVPLPAL